MIKFKGKSSDDFKLKLLSEITYQSATDNLQDEKIAGLDGSLFYGDKTLSNVELIFPFDYRGSEIEKDKTKISEWLKSDTTWSFLEFSGEPEYYYVARHNDSISTKRFFNFYGQIDLSFIVKPYKYLKTGLNEIVLPSSIINPTNRTAKPILTIKGTGNITLTIGKSVLTLKNVESGVRIDSLAQTITTLDKTRNLFTNMTSYPFPVIEPGTQKITVTGTTTEIKIIPRWEVIV